VIVVGVEAALGVAVGVVVVVVGVAARRGRRGRHNETWPEWWQPFPERPPNVRVLPRERRPR
jgi:hypothetical protein